MVGIACSACVQALMLVVALLSPSTQPAARAVEPAHVRGCVSARPSGDGSEANDTPEYEPLPLHAMSVLGTVKGSEFKFGFYRGVGGGLRVVTTDEGVSLTFEGGFGLGGSFSAGTVDGLPKPGPAAEGRVSLNARALPVQPPDFGVTLDPDGRLRGYTDVKAGKIRTRFYSEPFHLMGDARDAKEADAPVVRRSWSLGSEFKIAIKYTFRSTWTTIIGLLASLATHLPSLQSFQVLLSRPVETDAVCVILDQQCANRALNAPPADDTCRGPVPARTGNAGRPSRAARRPRHGRTKRTPTSRAARARKSRRRLRAAIRRGCRTTTRIGPPGR